MKWYADNSRHSLGHVCPFARYLRYHHGGTGYATPDASPELKMGTAIHENVERAYMWLQQGGQLPDAKITDNKFCQATVSGYEDTVTGLTHAYVRYILPWVHESYEVVSVEPEMSIDLGNDIIWMARPDVVVRHRQTRAHSIIEFKTTSARPEKMASIYKHSLQTLMNAHAVKLNYGDCSAVQVHIMQRGNKDYPTALTHAYYRVANPPFTPEDWQPHRKKPDGTYVGKLYRKVQVSEYRPLADWVWSMPLNVVADYVPIILGDLDPTEHGLKVEAAIAAIRTEEEWWRETLMFRSNGGPPIHGAPGCDVARQIPRSFQCVQYERTCDYYSVCFDPNNWTKPIELGNFIPRKPHHEQEIIHNIFDKEEKK